jgi:sigma-B regulation protein RsbU (phosphoserine phosphatase)
VKAAAERDLRIAREIQMGLLPTNIRTQTQGTGLDVDAALEPAHQVGGDLYEVLRLGPDRVLVAVGDVSGKGIPAALFMAVTMTLLRSMARQGYGVEEILRRLNDELLEQNPRGMFVTMQLMVFDTAARTVTCASAGHHAAARLSAGRPPEPAFTSSGRVLGLLPSEPIPPETIAVKPGDTFVLFTDGVSEAFDANGDLFGEERLLAHLASATATAPLAAAAGASTSAAAVTAAGAAAGAGSAGAITAGVLQAVRNHAAGTKQSDDITIVTVRYNGLGLG